MMKDNTNSGFSLIELIIAMTILLVLSGMIFWEAIQQEEKKRRNMRPLSAMRS